MAKFFEAVGGWFEKGNSKNLTKHLLLGSLGIALLLMGGLFSSNSTPKAETTPQSEKTPQVITQDQGEANIAEAEKDLEQRLEQVLEKIDGVGSVNATVSLASTNEQEYAVNSTSGRKVTNEKDQSGGTRVITENSDNDQMVLVHQNQSSNETPVVIKETKPEVQGVVVVADGAADPEIKAELVNAVQTLLNLPAHKVTVLPKESR